MIDEYDELADESTAATGHADSLARGRAVAVTLLAATQRPTQKAMGSGAVRSPMDVRICLRVRERRDINLILGQRMLTAGWAADTLNAPGKFLISTPVHTAPRRARAYHLGDRDVAAIAARHADGQPRLDALSRDSVAPPDVLVDPPAEPVELDDPAAILWAALLDAPDHGRSVRELKTATEMGRTWVYARLQEHAADGRVAQISRGRWAVTKPETPRWASRPRGRPRREYAHTRRRARRTDVRADVPTPSRGAGRPTRRSELRGHGDLSAWPWQRPTPTSQPEPLCAATSPRAGSPAIGSVLVC